jgi:glycosyltransferase involved in cell wall biosynthesis
MTKRYQYISVGKTIKEAEYRALEEKGIERERVIESTFCFKLNDTHGTLSRSQLNLPEGKFLMGVVGIRLDADVSTDFLNAMEKTLDWNTHLVFVGKFDSYQMRCAQFPWLQEHSSYIGYQKDILAVWNCLNLYVNPKRLGGGFSIIEAFYMGVPGVTIDFGDVSASGGIDFCVDDYDEMLETIHRYITDADFYQAMVQKGLARTEKVFDAKGAMEHILAEAERREFFF